MDDHARLDRARTGGGQHPGTLDLDHADAAGILGSERVAVTQRGDGRPHVPGRCQDRGALGHAPYFTVDGDLDQPTRQLGGDGRSNRDGHAGKTSRRSMAEAMAEAAVWPSPQMEASRMTVPTSARRASSSARLPSGRSAARRSRVSAWRTVPTRQGTHCPHDSCLKNAAIRSKKAARSTPSSMTITAPDPRVAPAA